MSAHAVVSVMQTYELCVCRTFFVCRQFLHIARAKFCAEHCALVFQSGSWKFTSMSGRCHRDLRSSRSFLLSSSQSHTRRTCTTFSQTQWWTCSLLCMARTGAPLCSMKCDVITRTTFVRLQLLSMNPHLRLDECETL